MISVVEARRAHLPFLEQRMRQQERDECQALGYTPAQALEVAFSNAAMAWTGLTDDEPVCMYGLTPTSLLSREAKPWLLTTELILAHQHSFLRRSRESVPAMLALFPRLADMVDARNTVSIRWLRWMGFTIGEPVPWGVAGEKFRPFEMEA